MYDLPAAHNPSKPKNHLPMAIAAVFFFWPLAIYSILQASQADTFWFQGRSDEAQKASVAAKTTAVLCMVIGSVLLSLTLASFLGLVREIGREIYMYSL